MRALLLLTTGLLCLSACAGTRPSFLPARSCERAWRRLPASTWSYDYHKDVRPTKNGNEGYEGYARRVQRQSCYKDWTVLVYMEADNDLTPYAYLDLYEMEAGYEGGKLWAGSTPRTDVVVQLDAPGHTGTRRLHMFQTPTPYNDRLSTAQLTALRETDVKSPIVSFVPPPPPSTGDAAAAQLHDFLRWGMQRYPAQHYLVIVWGHGQGWAPARKPADSPLGTRPPIQGPDTVRPRSAQVTGPFSGQWLGGIAFDYTAGSYLTIPALHDALRQAEDEAHGGQPIDVYASDACLMQMAEVATELSDTARFVTGSTQIQNYYGLPYRTLLYEINSGRYAGLRDPDAGQRMARLIPMVEGLAFAQGGMLARLAPDGDKSLTMSSLSSTSLREDLLPALSAVARALVGYLREDPLHAAGLSAVLRDGPDFLGGSRDIGAFLDATRQVVLKEAGTASPSPATSELLRAIDLCAFALRRAVIGFAYGSDYRDEHGMPLFPDYRVLSAWLPATAEDYAARVNDFTPSRFYRNGAPDGQPGPWQEFLDLVFRRGP